MTGLELSRKFYEKYGRPMLEEKFPQYLDRIATGRVGNGSECYHCDDAISREHEFGPSFCIWLTSKDYMQWGRKIAAAYDNLPKTFEGEIFETITPQGAGRVGVLDFEEFYKGIMGFSNVPDKEVQWLFIEEPFLYTATNGEVYDDPLGEFTRIRQGLLNYYPEDVWLKKMSMCAHNIAQTGQYNYSRCMRRKEYVAAELTFNEFLNHAISMVYMLNKQYRPYYKWSYHCMDRLDVLREIKPMLTTLVLAGDQREHWKTEDIMKWQYQVNMADMRVRYIEEICQHLAQEIVRQGLSHQKADFLEAYVEDIVKKITNPRIKYM